MIFNMFAFRGYFAYLNYKKHFSYLFYVIFTALLIKLLQRLNEHLKNQKWIFVLNLCQNIRFIGNHPLPLVSYGDFNLFFCIY